MDVLDLFTSPPHLRPMPRSQYAATRPQLIDWLCERLTSGETLQQLAHRPETPAWDTLMRWQREDPALKTRFANARAHGRGVRFQARHADRFGFPSADALALIERVRAGERLSDLVDAGRPGRAALNAWKRINPEFAAQLAAATQASRVLRRRLRGDGPPYDEATADAIMLRVRYGETLRQVCRDPVMPAFTVVGRWRRRHPDFDAALKAHKADAFRAQMAARAGPTPGQMKEMGVRIAAGASLAELCASPDMPCRHTLLRWRRERPELAEVIDDACDFRDWLLADHAEHLLDTGTTPEARREAAALNHRRAVLGGRGRRATEGP
jgi:hypothetical protein